MPIIEACLPVLFQYKVCNEMIYNRSLCKTVTKIDKTKIYDK